ncbi:ABC transporter ATP-binding protein [Caproiciproducens sp. R1]|uniref:ABC transporter ATP-binding protein n=1 Tax=Caproiciproducens sp. R1 TaxID=3435000 RepID=UPI004033A32C
MKSDKKGLALLLEWAGKDRRYLYASIVLALLSSLSTIVPYFAFYKIIDAVVLGTCDLAFALKWAVIVLIATAVRVCCNLAATLASHRGAYNTLFRVRCMVTEHMAKMPLGALNERSTGEIKYVMNESIEKLELFLAHNLPELVLYLSGPIVMFLYLLTVNAALALLSIVPIFLVAAVMALMFQRFGKFMPEVNASSGNLSSSIHEYVNGMRLIKAYHMGAQSFKKYSSAIEAQHRMWGAISKATGPLYAAYVVLLECGILFLVPLGGYFFVHGSISAGVLLLFAFVGTQYLTDIRPLQELGSNLSYVLNGVNQVNEILETPVFGDGRSFPKRHDIELRNMSFSYTEGEPVLEHVDLHIAHGERVAFVGVSGAGKSTLVQLISRFYDVSEGGIAIGGVDVKDIDYEQLLQNISVVFQSSFLTRGSVFENIAMGNRAVTLEEVRTAAREAQIDGFIMSLPDGYETKVGSYGTRFSGGQKQRICIARAILKNAPILILDEATSAADPENQVEIDRAIENLCQGKTVIIVAHRLGIVQGCDRIAVVEKRGISRIGSFDDMRENNPYFAGAWRDYNAARSIRYSLKGGKEA